jgi:MrfA Zn-binding domain
VSELGDFQRQRSRAVQSLCSNFIVNHGRLAYQVVEISSEGPSVTPELEQFVNFKLKILSDAGANAKWKLFELQQLQEPHYNVPVKIKVELYPRTFVCSNPACGILREFEHLPAAPVKCISCGFPLSQLSLVLVCRECGSLRQVFTKCPFCRAPIRMVELRHALHWECTNPRCGAHPQFTGKGKKSDFYRRFDRTVNFWRKPREAMCSERCHSTLFNPRDGPLFQTRAREKLYSAYKDSYVTYYARSGSKLATIPSIADIEYFGFSNINEGDYVVHNFIFGYDRYAKFEDRLRAKKLRVEPFGRPGGGVDIYYHKMNTVGVSLQLDSHVVEEVLREYRPVAKSATGRKKDEFEYLKSQIKVEWSKVGDSKLKDSGLSVSEDELTSETLRRILIHTVKHALLVEAPRHCGLDYGEIGGYYKTKGMLSQGDEKLENDALYIYDNTNYGSGVTSSLVSRDAFGNWLNGSLERLKCFRNKCSTGCKACIFLPSTVCSKMNVGLDRELADRYFISIQKRVTI